MAKSKAESNVEFTNAAVAAAAELVKRDPDAVMAAMGTEGEESVDTAKVEVEVKKTKGYYASIGVTLHEELAEAEAKVAEVRYRIDQNIRLLNNAPEN